LTVSSHLVHVAVGVILSPENKILIALRHPNSHQGGLWEFPGGKVEVGESVERALARELDEELGIELGEVRPLMTIKHDYPDKSVCLDVWWVERFSGEPEGREGQLIRWVSIADLMNYAFPPANAAIVEAIQASD
jgi:8-oxo-dGTP diphosphatase